MEMHPIEMDIEKVFNQAAAVSDEKEEPESEAKPKRVTIKEDDKDSKEEVININQAHKILGHPERQLCMRKPKHSSGS